MRISSLEVAAIVAIGLTTVQLQSPDPARTGQAMRTLAAQPDVQPELQPGVQPERPPQVLLPSERLVRLPRPQEAVASN